MFAISVMSLFDSWCFCVFSNSKPLSPAPEDLEEEALDRFDEDSCISSRRGKTTPICTIVLPVILLESCKLVCDRA